MFGIGLPELIVILIIALLLFGSSKLPELAAALGKSIGAFKKGLREGEEDNKEPSKPAIPSKDDTDKNR